MALGLYHPGGEHMAVMSRLLEHYGDHEVAPGISYANVWAWQAEDLNEAFALLRFST